MADLHLLCGQALLAFKTIPSLLGLTAHQHLEKAKAFALDVSEFADIYESTDPNFYKGIPEYDMLKRGPTDEERIKNGYYPVYRMAQALEPYLARMD